jgi:hypothetical protein
MDSEREEKQRERDGWFWKQVAGVLGEHAGVTADPVYSPYSAPPSQSSPSPSQFYNRILYAFLLRLHSFLALPNNSFLRMLIHFMNCLQHRLNNTGPLFLLLMNSNVEGNVSILPVGHLLCFSSHKQSIYMGNVEIVVFFLLTVGSKLSFLGICFKLKIL